MSRQTSSLDDSLTLQGLDLPNNVPEPPTSPVGPVRVDMRDCCVSSDDELASPQPINLESQYVNAHTQQENYVGWTFYNSVVGQVNKMLEASPAAETGKAQPCGSGHASSPEIMHQTAAEHLRKLDIGRCDQHAAEQTALGKRVTFDAGVYPRMDRAAVNNSNESESSLRINALALKYLKDDQLTEFHRLSAGGVKGPERLQDLTVYGMTTQTTNLSFATLRYLERYHLLPSSKNGSGGNVLGMNRAEPRTAASCQQTHSPVKIPYKVLDVTTLRQQPKLL